MDTDPLTLKETPSQTAGPYVHIGLAPRAAGVDTRHPPLGAVIAGPGAAGERIRVQGTVIDGTGAPVTDMLMEVWQANASGLYRQGQDDPDIEEDFNGWGRVVPDFDTGVWVLDTIKPGPQNAGDGRLMAPHLNLWIVARGINVGLNTRVYFEDEETANAADPVLSDLAVDRRGTLLARRTGSAPGVYRFDVRLQGEGETVFFDI